MNSTAQHLLNVLNNITVSRELMFDVTEIPHCMDMLDQTHFSLDMKRIKSAHQYMKGNIPEKMYQQIKKCLQKYLYVLLECHKELISIDPDNIIDDDTHQIYLYVKSYFTNKSSKSYDQVISSALLKETEADFDQCY